MNYTKDSRNIEVTDKTSRYIRPADTLSDVIIGFVSSSFFLWSDNGIKKCIDPSRRRTERKLEPLFIQKLLDLLRIVRLSASGLFSKLKTSVCCVKNHFPKSRDKLK